MALCKGYILNGGGKMEESIVSKSKYEERQHAPTDKSRSLTYATGTLRGPDLRKNFGLNVECCLKLIGSNLDSLSLRTDITKVVLVGFKMGNTEVTDERVEAIANDLDLRPSDLLMEYKTSDARDSAFRNIFAHKGRIMNGAGLIGGNASHPAPDVPSAKPASAEVLAKPAVVADTVQSAQVVEPKTPAHKTDEELLAFEVEPVGTGDTSDASHEESTVLVEQELPVQLPVTEPSSVSVIEHSEVEPVMNTDANEVTWDGNDLIATIGKRTVNLIDKEVRRKVISHVRQVAEAKDFTLTELMVKAKLGKQSSWVNGVEQGNGRIYGTQIESIAEACDTTVEFLLTGKKTVWIEVKSVSDVEQAEPPTPPLADVQQPEATSPVVEQPEEPTPAPAIAGEPTRLVQTAEQDYFRGKFLSDTTKPASGVPFGLLLKQASGEGSLDWPTAFFTLTEEGEEMKSNMDKLVADFLAYPAAIQDVLLNMITK